LSNNDIFIQPYRTLASTVDLPLLLLEAQAAGCTTLTTLPKVLNDYLYDKSEAIEGDFVEQSICRLNNIMSNSLSCCMTNEGLTSLQAEYSEKAIEDRLKEILNV
jgi:hypothetical protein